MEHFDLSMSHFWFSEIIFHVLYIMFYKERCCLQASRGTHSSEHSDVTVVERPASVWIEDSKVRSVNEKKRTRLEKGSIENG